MITYALYFSGVKKKILICYLIKDNYNIGRKNKNIFDGNFLIQ